MQGILELVSKLEKSFFVVPLDYFFQCATISQVLTTLLYLFFLIILNIVRREIPPPLNYLCNI